MTEDTARVPVTHAPDGSAYADHFWFSVALFAQEPNGELSVMQTTISAPPVCQCGKCESPTVNDVVRVVMGNFQREFPETTIVAANAVLLSDKWKIEPYGEPSSFYVYGEQAPDRREMN